MTRAYTATHDTITPSRNTREGNNMINAIKERINFVNNELNACVKATGRYAGTHMDENDTDTVKLICLNGYKYYVNVAADSLQGIMQDVIKEMGRH